MSPKTSEMAGGTEDALRRYLVTCDDCALEEVAEGREKAVERAQRHGDETDHDVVVVEAPPEGSPR